MRYNVMRFFLCLSTFFLLAVGLEVYSEPIYVRELKFPRNGPHQLPVFECNSVAFSRIESDKYIGRVLYRGDGRKCTTPLWTLSIFQRSPGRPFVRLDRSISMPLQVGPVVVTSAYDPYILKDKDRLWAVFECAGVNISGTAICGIGLTPDLNFDAGSFSIIAEEILFFDGSSEAAAVPKIFSSGEDNYLIWTAIKKSKSGFASKIFPRIRPIRVIDGKLSIYIPDFIIKDKKEQPEEFDIRVISHRTYDVIDIFDVFKDSSGSLFAIGATDGNKNPDRKYDCNRPSIFPFPCYAIEIFEFQKVGDTEFQLRQARTFVSMGILNPHEYSRIQRDQDRLSIVIRIFPDPRSLPPWNRLDGLFEIDLSR